MKGSDGKYHIKGSTYGLLIGSRAQVHHGTAYKTSGNLKKSQLLKNKSGRYVSAKKHKTAKAERRLEKHGWKLAEKGKFGAVRATPRHSPKKSRRSTRRRHRTA